MRSSSIRSRTEVKWILKTTIGFFDPDGYFFNTEGYDDVGGYYDRRGNYCDADFDCGKPEEDAGEEDRLYAEYQREQHIEPIRCWVQAASEGFTFFAVLGNLPSAATHDQVKNELLKHHVTFQKIELKQDSERKLRSVDLHINSKAAAGALLDLNGEPFLGRKLRVDFPDCGLEEDPLVTVARTTPKPGEEEKSAVGQKAETA